MRAGRRRGKRATRWRSGRSPYGELSAPALTTVHIDAQDHGRKTARVTLGLDSDGFSAAPATVIVRDSA
jgi:DNA-binding LacI/PurR family transcriptional regulator